MSFHPALSGVRYLIFDYTRSSAKIVLAQPGGSIVLEMSMRMRLLPLLAPLVLVLLGLIGASRGADKNPMENLVTALEKANLSPDIFERFKDFLTRYPFSNGSDPNSERSKRLYYHFRLDKQEKKGVKRSAEGQLVERSGRRGSNRFYMALLATVSVITSIASLFAPSPPPPVTNIIQEYHNTFNTNASSKCECNCNTICAQPACPMLPANPKECAYFPVCDSRCELVVDEAPASTTTVRPPTTTTKRSSTSSSSKPAGRRYALLRLLIEDLRQPEAAQRLAKTAASPAAGPKHKLLLLLLNNPSHLNKTSRRRSAKSRSFQDMARQVGSVNIGIVYLHDRVKEMAPTDERVRDDIISLVQLNASRLNEVEPKLVGNMRYLIEYYKDRVPSNMPDTASADWARELRAKMGAVLTAGYSVMGHAVQLSLAAQGRAGEGKKQAQNVNYKLDMSCHCNNNCFGSIERCELVCPSNNAGCSTSRCECSRPRRPAPGSSARV